MNYIEAGGWVPVDYTVQPHVARSVPADGAPELVLACHTATYLNIHCVPGGVPTYQNSGRVTLVVTSIGFQLFKVYAGGIVMYQVFC